MIILYKVVLTFMYGGVQFPVVLFIMLHKVVLTFESVNKILKCDPSNKSY